MKKAQKTKPIGTRFNLQQLELVKNREGLASEQQVIDFLLNDYELRVKGVLDNPTFARHVKQTVEGILSLGNRLPTMPQNEEKPAKPTKAPITHKESVEPKSDKTEMSDYMKKRQQSKMGG
jgi:hypothetical protein